MSLVRYSLALVACAGFGGCAGSVGDDALDVDPASAVTHPVTFKTAAGRFLTAANGGGAGVDASGSSAGAFQTFTLYDINGGALVSGDTVWLAAGNGQYVSAEQGGGGVLNANRAAAKSWETFKLVRLAGGGNLADGDGIALQTTVGKQYVTAAKGGGGAVTATASKVGANETFVIGVDFKNPPADMGMGHGGSAGGAGGSGGGDGNMTAAQKLVAEELTSIWENDTPVLAYAYAENIQDGRGYTSGRAGFCTGTGDAIQVIHCYDTLRTAANGNLMAKYMPALTTINDKFESTGQDQGDTGLLDAVGSWVKDWAASYNTAATQADFKSCQDQVSDALYYQPAMAAAKKYGLKWALTKAELYDMWINQGGDALVKQTNQALGVTSTVTDENAWLQKFIELRRDLLAGDSTWKDSVDRLAAYEKARRRGNVDLLQPMANDVRAKDCWPTGGYSDSGYTTRVINPDGTWSTAKSVTYSCN
jgi:hypothetical protein